MNGSWKIGEWNSCLNPDHPDRSFVRLHLQFVKLPTVGMDKSRSGCGEGCGVGTVLKISVALKVRWRATLIQSKCIHPPSLGNACDAASSRESPAHTEIHTWIDQTSVQTFGVGWTAPNIRQNGGKMSRLKRPVVGVEEDIKLLQSTAPTTRWSPDSAGEFMFHLVNMEWTKWNLRNLISCWFVYLLLFLNVYFVLHFLLLYLFIQRYKLYIEIINPFLVAIWITNQSLSSSTVIN